MVVRDCHTVLDNATSDIDRAGLLAVKADHSSEWIFGLPISACDLHISNEAVRIAIGLRLRINLCKAHSCPFGGAVDAKGIHGLSCKRSAGRSIRRQQISLACSTHSRHSVCQKKPSGFLPGEKKRPGGLKLVPWQGGHCLAWDATAVDTLTPSCRRQRPGH